MRVTYLRDQDPLSFLTDPVLAPLAVLTRGTLEEREQSFTTAVRLIIDSGHPWTSELLLTAETLAHIRLDSPTIDRIRKEHAMTIGPLVDFWRDTETGHRLQNIGREEGREEEKEKMLLALLHRRFGDQPETAPILRHLAEWSETDALNAILDAPDITSLLTADPPV